MMRRHTASPIPAPSTRSFARENMLKIRLASAASTPRPLSRIVTTHSWLSGTDETSIRSGASARNFTAFASRFCSTRRSCRASPWASGSSPHLERRARLVEPPAQVLGDLGHELAEPDRLAAQLAGARVDEHAVDEVARSLGARPQLPQDGGRRRLPGAPLEQPDEHRDARDRLAQVVRHDVGVVAQLGLHAPVLGDVGEEVDEPVAEPGGAVHERAQHVAVAERHVVRHLGDPRLTGLAHLDVVVERAAVAHPRERLEQRVAVVRGGRDAEGAQHRGVPVAEREVDDPPAIVAQRPQHADRFREAVEERAELGRSLHAQQLDQLRILAPGLGVRGGSAFGHVRRIGRCH